MFYASILKTCIFPGPIWAILIHDFWDWGYRNLHYNKFSQWFWCYYSWPNNWNSALDNSQGSLWLWHIRIWEQIWTSKVIVWHHLSSSCLGFSFIKEFLARICKGNKGYTLAKGCLESLLAKTFPSFCSGVQPKRLTKNWAGLGCDSGQGRQKLKSPHLLLCHFLIRLQPWLCNGIIIIIFVFLPSICNANSNPQKSNIY